MVTSNAGYATGRQGRFTWSGALRPLRLARLSRCRRFWPSPFPTHDGERWATTPPADFGPVTPTAFEIGLSLTPLAAQTACGVDLPG
jgi:hypothetical protein